MRRLFVVPLLAISAVSCKGEEVTETPTGDSAAAPDTAAAGGDATVDTGDPVDSTPPGDSTVPDSTVTVTDSSTTVTDSSPSMTDSTLADVPKPPPDVLYLYDATAPSGPCPVGKLGVRPMIYIPAMKYCIDQNEVTDAEYNSLLLESPASRPKYPDRIKYCETRTVYGDTRASTNKAAVNVEWCHAWQYCALMGKRLCGKHKSLGGGGLAESELTSAAVSQWTYACKGGDPGKRFPYGNDYDASRCAVGRVTPALVDEYPSCQGGVPGVFNMSGNVAEWEDACNDFGDAGATTSCRTRGGWFSLDKEDELQCETTHSWAINTPMPTVGFRCCADVP